MTDIKDKLRKIGKYGLVFLLGVAANAGLNNLTQEDPKREVRNVTIELPSGTTVYTAEKNPGEFVSIGGAYDNVSTMETEYKIIRNSGYKVTVY